MAETSQTTPIGELPQRRRWINHITRYVVALGGAGVIGAIGLIFFYLLWVIAPIFSGGSIEFAREIELANPVGARLLDINETGEIGVAVLADGEVDFFHLADGSSITSTNLGGRPAVVAQPVFQDQGTYAILDDSAGIWFVTADYPVTFEGDRRMIKPVPRFPFEQEPVPLRGTVAFDVIRDELTLTIAAIDARRHLFIDHYREVEEGYPLELPRKARINLERDYAQVFFGPRGRWLYLISDTGEIEVLDVSRPTSPRSELVSRLVPVGERPAAITPLLGRYSMLVADRTNHVTQWFLVRDEFGYQFHSVRTFPTEGPVAEILIEPRRKGFVTLSPGGQMGLFYTTSERRIARLESALRPGSTGVISPRSDRLLMEVAPGRLARYDLHNEHPEISWSSLWSRVWYEGYPEPVFSWQSSSAENDFEPKFSLVPLAFGTLKAAFYAMVFAVPLAIMGAVYTAFFMSPSMRRLVKPGIEIMAALPTVILGFLAGLWLAPLIEDNLASVLTVFVVMPLGMLLLARLFSLLPETIVGRLQGWYGALAAPAVALLIALSFWIGPWLESVLFAGPVQSWLLETLGIPYDQRNALIVGIAMGLAVIPTIFSIAEDAIFGVPTHLVNGSLALGATPWQTLVRVVLLTASPGIFSAVMIGLGRAVGETMIVLMATGNTPIMDMNVFEGMRTFAANIAVELPEAEVESTHYRILFLTAMVLFLITFVFNTVAEIVRQRLRARYGNL